MIDESKIKGDIAAAFKSVMDDDSDNREGAIETVAGKMAKAVADAIKSATITYTAGLVAPNGPVTGVFNGTIT